MKTVELMQKVAEVAPDKYRFIVKTAAEVRESPFRKEIVDELDRLVKKAGFMSAMQGMGGAAGKALGTGAAAVGGAVAGGIAFSLAGDMYDALKRGITKGRNYRTMMRENPDLADLPARNVQRTFSTLHRFNPEFASDPMVAGSYVRRQAQYAEFDPKGLTDLVNSRKNIGDARRLPQVPSLPRKQEGVSREDYKKMMHGMNDANSGIDSIHRMMEKAVPGE